MEECVGGCMDGWKEDESSRVDRQLFAGGGVGKWIMEE